MLQNYLKIAFRNIWRQRGYNALNIAGLAVGMVSCLLILLYVQHELSFDRFHANADRLYRVTMSVKMGDINGEVGSTPPPIAKRLTDEIPEIKRATRILPISTSVLRYENKVFNETNVLATDEQFLQMFSFKVLEGSSNLLLSEPNTLVLTKRAAQKYFGTESALGKTLLMDNEARPCKVVGVVENPPDNAHFTFDVLTSISSFGAVKRFDWSWVWWQLVTYVELKEGASLQAVQAKLPLVVNKYAPLALKRLGRSFDDIKQKGGHWNLDLQPLHAIHLYSRTLGNRLGEVGNINTVYILSAIAILIITLACINFMNLATARSARRAKEIGIRKSLGVPRRQLVMQFLSESLLLSVIAMACALCLAELVLQPFNTLAGKSLTLDVVSNPLLAASILALTLVVGVVSGVYPAFYLSSVKPVEVLSGKLRLGMKSAGIRNVLVVFQFAVSVALIACTLVVYLQLDFVHTMNLGFDKENVITIDNANRLGEQRESFRQSVLAESSVSDMSFSTFRLGQGSFGDTYTPEESSLPEIELSSYMTDEAFVPTLGLKVLQGVNFSKESPADCEEGVILNEEAVKEIGWKQPIGKYITYPGGDGAKFRVIGVVKDFNVESQRAPIRPFALFHRASKTYSIRASCVIARVRAGQSREAVAALERSWKRFAGGAPFEYSFADEDFDKLFRAEQRLGNVLGTFTTIAIVIACLGLFGLAAFTAEQRTKEIGIRKVLGASVASIITLLTQDFLKLVGVAIIIATPLAYWGMGKWLQDFAYRVELTWWLFVVAGLTAVIIAFITVASQAWRAAGANPVQSLRSE